MRRMCCTISSPGCCASTHWSGWSKAAGGCAATFPPPSRASSPTGVKARHAASSPPGATVVVTVGGSPAASVHAAELAANGATALNVPGTIVKRDGAGNVTVGTIAGALAGNARTATTAFGIATPLSVGGSTSAGQALVTATNGGNGAAALKGVSTENQQTNNGTGVLGADFGIGVQGQSNFGYGMSASSGNNFGLVATTGAGAAWAGVYGSSSSIAGIGVEGEANGTGPIGVLGKNTTGWAGYFSGNAAVTGNLSLGLTNQLSAAAGDESLRIVRGTINSTGGTTNGSGFTVTHGAGSTYIITFPTPFAGVPTVTASPFVHANPPFGTQNYVANLVGVTVNSVEVSISLTGQSASADESFSFIADGPR